jgi:hypothetical protein
MHVMHTRNNSKTDRDKKIIDIEKLDNDGYFNDFKTNKRLKK